MAAIAQGFVAAAAPTQIARVTQTTLYHLAAKYYGNALYWNQIAVANGMIDPYIFGSAEIIIPKLVRTASPDGILGL